MENEFILGVIRGGGVLREGTVWRVIVKKCGGGGGGLVDLEFVLKVL